MREHPHRVAILVLEHVVPFDLGIPYQIFAYGRPDLGEVRYQARICAPAPGRVRTAGEHDATFVIETPHGLEALEWAETVVVPGTEALTGPVPESVLDALRAAHRRGARIASICTGAFILAAAGILDGRRAVTHWKDAPLLAARFPAVRVDASVLYVDEGQVLTSGGLAAGIDLCLHLVREDCGAEVANTVARRLVVAPHRSGGQAQYAERPLPGTAAGGLETTRAWMLEHLNQPLTLDGMAAHAHMSRRNFARRFREEAGASPLQWLIHQRVLLAQRLLESTDEPLERLASRCGFGSALVLRQHFRRATGMTPLSYRLAFRGPARDHHPTTPSAAAVTSAG